MYVCTDVYVSCYKYDYTTFMNICKFNFLYLEKEHWLMVMVTFTERWVSRGSRCRTNEFSIYCRHDRTAVTATYMPSRAPMRTYACQMTFVTRNTD